MRKGYGRGDERNPLQAARFHQVRRHLAGQEHDRVDLAHEHARRELGIAEPLDPEAYLVLQELRGGLGGDQGAAAEDLHVPEREVDHHGSLARVSDQRQRGIHGAHPMAGPGKVSLRAG